MLKNHILVCTQTKPPMVPSCGGVGSPEVMDILRAEVFKAGLEKEVLITGTGCIGICNRGPNVVVYPEGKWYTGVTKEMAKEIVDSHIKEGKVLESKDGLDDNTLKFEVGMFQERIKMMMQDAGRL